MGGFLEDLLAPVFALYSQNGLCDFSVRGLNCRHFHGKKRQIGFAALSQAEKPQIYKISGATTA